MNLEAQDKDPSTVTKPATTFPASASTETATSRDILAMKLKLAAKELKCFQEMVTTDVRMKHLLQTAAQEGIDMPALPSLPPCQEPFGEVAAVQPQFPIEGLVLLAGNTTIDSGNKEDGKVNNECLRYKFSCGRFPLRPNSCDGSWSKEPECCSMPGWQLTPVTVQLGYKQWA